MAIKNGSRPSERTKSKSTKAVTKHDRIALRAYEIYLQRNGAPGDPLEDWVRAENELLHAGVGGRKSRKLAAEAV
jgi:hypothetical protein